MKKMLKALAMVVSITILVAMVAGCGTAKDKDDQGRTMITVGSWPDKEGTELDNMNERKEAFETVNPDVVVIPDLWEFERRTFYAKAAGGQLPIV